MFSIFSKFSKKKKKLELFLFLSFFSFLFSSPIHEKQKIGRKTKGALLIHEQDTD